MSRRTSSCDLEFIIQTNNRVAINPPTPVNANFVVDGHNTAVYAQNNNFYYIENGRERGDPPGVGYAVYPSVPLDLLFQNPDGPL